MLSLSLSNQPNQGFYWDEQWLPSAHHAQSVGLGHDILSIVCPCIRGGIKANNFPSLKHQVPLKDLTLLAIVEWLVPGQHIECTPKVLICGVGGADGGPIDLGAS